MKYKNIMPAVPGSMLIHYNHRNNKTYSEPILFWGVSYEDEHTFVCPFTVTNEFASVFQTPSYDEDSKNQSEVIAFEIPGWGRIEADWTRQREGRFTTGFDLNFKGNNI
jgi:hypothetical protein